MFLADPLDVPWPVVDYLAGSSGVADASSVKRYAERQSTQCEHAAEIRQAYGYRDFTDDGAAAGGAGVHGRRGRGRGPRGRGRCSIRRWRGCAGTGCCCRGRACWPGWSPASATARATACTEVLADAAARRPIRQLPGRLARACWRCRMAPASRSWSGCGRAPPRRRHRDDAVAGPGLGNARARRAVGGPGGGAGEPGGGAGPVRAGGPRPRRCADLTEPRRTATLLADRPAPGGRPRSMTCWTCSTLLMATKLLSVGASGSRASSGSGTCPGWPGPRSPSQGGAGCCWRP